MFNAACVAILIATTSLTASSALAVMSAVNPALASNVDSRPRKVVLLPPQIFVYELSAGGVPTRMTEWESQARQNMTAAATRLAGESGVFDVVAAPAPAPDEQDSLDAHIGLYDRVAQSVFVYGRGEQSAWAHKKAEFDYTVGPGLAFVAGLALGVIMPLGQSFVAAGVVDLATGDVQWMGFDASSSLDTRNAPEVDALVRALYKTWPGGR